MARKNSRSAWLGVVWPGVTIGGKLFSSKPRVIDMIIKGLLQVRIATKNIIIWKADPLGLYNAGSSGKSLPGIEIAGTELKGTQLTLRY